MNITALDHFTIRTSKLGATTAFFEQVAGLSIGPRPEFKFDGRWLYRGDWAAVHLAAFDPDDEELRAYLGDRKTTGAEGPGALDHIAFRCTDLPSFEAHLHDLGVRYRARTVPGLSEHQVFVVEPNGITVEFIFASSEPASWVGQAAS